MVYSEVVTNGWVLAKKAKYTIRDVNSVVVNSLFGKYGNRTFSEIEAAFIVRCSAAHWDTEYSKSVAMTGKKVRL